MSLTIRLSTTMTAEEMAPLWPSIVTCLEKYCARFSDQETVGHMLQQIMAGHRQLWLVQDEAGRVVLTPITEIVRNDATGKQYLLFAECGGERLREAMPLMREIEEWAKREHGVTEAQFIGRKGWTKLLEPLGYKPKAVIWEKSL